MPMKSLGLVTVAAAGTPVRLATVPTPCNSINIQPVKSVNPKVENAGALYLLLNGNTKATALAAGMLYALSSGQPAATVQPQQGSLAFADDLMNYCLDADTSGDGALVSYD